MKKAGLGMSVFCIMMLLAVSSVQAQRDYGVHDPCNIVKDGDTYYTFYTSNGVECAYSTDLCTWRRGGRIFPSGFPSWITQYVPGFGGHFWAPEVIYMNGKWHVYYSCSSFGSRESAIGLATSPSLKNPQWQDHGMVVYTNSSSNHNAIDADVMRTSDGKVYLIYGSFWNGIVMTELDSTTGKPINRANLTYVANGNPEAAAAIEYGGYYYLFFNRGKCCSGVNSTYEIFVGRSTNPTGPFLDKNGTRTSSGGGTLVLSTQGRFIGPGHFGYFTENGREYMSYHYYDADQNGASKLKIITLSWRDGWPVLNTTFNPCNAEPVKDCAGVDNGTAYLDNCGSCVGGTTGLQSCKQDCNGVWGGSAYTDTCGFCVEGTTEISPCIGSIQGEEAFEYDGILETVNEGYIGEGYFNFTNATGSKASWSLCADETIQSSIIFRYANGTSATRALSISVNELVQLSDVSFPSTETWTNWKAKAVSLQLQKGNNTITLTSAGSEGGPNIDAIAFSNERIGRCIPVNVKRVVIPEGKSIALRYANGAVTFFTESENHISLHVYSISGRLIKTLYSGSANKGLNRILIDPSVINSGVCLMVLYSQNVKHTERISVW